MSTYNGAKYIDKQLESIYHQKGLDDYVLKLIIRDDGSCDDTIDTAEFILHNINLFVLNEEIKQKTIDYLKEAINIAERDKKEFINK